eukprot:Nk52_evm1s2539 gene=Nk52_evmTU1s2539
MIPLFESWIKRYLLPSEDLEGLRASLSKRKKKGDKTCSDSNIDDLSDDDGSDSDSDGESDSKEDDENVLIARHVAKRGLEYDKEVLGIEEEEKEDEHLSPRRSARIKSKVHSYTQTDPMQEGKKDRKPSRDLGVQTDDVVIAEVLEKAPVDRKLRNDVKNMKKLLRTYFGVIDIVERGEFYLPKDQQYIEVDGKLISVLTTSPVEGRFGGNFPNLTGRTMSPVVADRLWDLSSLSYNMRIREALTGDHLGMEACSKNSLSVLVETAAVVNRSPCLDQNVDLADFGGILTLLSAEDFERKRENFSTLFAPIIGVESQSRECSLASEWAKRLVINVPMARPVSSASDIMRSDGEEYPLGQQSVTKFLKETMDMRVQDPQAIPWHLQVDLSESFNRSEKIILRHCIEGLRQLSTNFVEPPNFFVIGLMYNITIAKRKLDSRSSDGLHCSFKSFESTKKCLSQLREDQAHLRGKTDPFLDSVADHEFHKALGRLQ